MMSGRVCTARLAWVLRGSLCNCMGKWGEFGVSVGFGWCLNFFGDRWGRICLNQQLGCVDGRPRYMCAWWRCVWVGGWCAVACPVLGFVSVRVCVGVCRVLKTA